jgi:hypothetical protein
MSIHFAFLAIGDQMWPYHVIQAWTTAAFEQQQPLHFSTFPLAVSVLTAGEFKFPIHLIYLEKAYPIILSAHSELYSGRL